jgi:hypothetical protein
MSWPQYYSRRSHRRTAELSDRKSLLRLLYFVYGAEDHERRGGAASQGTTAETGETLTAAVAVILGEPDSEELAAPLGDALVRMGTPDLAAYQLLAG